MIVSVGYNAHTHVLCPRRRKLKSYSDTDTVVETALAARRFQRHHPSSFFTSFEMTDKPSRTHNARSHLHASRTAQRCCPTASERQTQQQHLSGERNAPHIGREPTADGHTAEPFKNFRSRQRPRLYTPERCLEPEHYQHCRPHIKIHNALRTRSRHRRRRPKNAFTAPTRFPAASNPPPVRR